MKIEGYEIEEVSEDDERLKNHVAVVSTKWKGDDSKWGYVIHINVVDDNKIYIIPDKKAAENLRRSTERWMKP